MGRQETLGFILIFVVLMAWMWMNTPTPPPPQPQPTEAIADTVQKVVPGKKEATIPEVDNVGEFFSRRAQGVEKILIIDTDLFTAEISSKGGRIRKWELKKFKTWRGDPVQLVDFDSGGDYSLLFTTSDGKFVNTRHLYFDSDYRPWQRVRLSGDETFEVQLTLPSANNGRLVKTFRFKNGEYGFESEYTFAGLANVIANYEYQVVWENGLRYAEENSVDESAFAAAYVHAGGELTSLDATHAGQPVERNMAGSIDWVATRNKYFGLAIMPQPGMSEGAFLGGEQRPMPDRGVYEQYNVAVKMPFRATLEEKASFRVFLGPLEYGLLASYDNNLESIMDLGWVWIVRPISVYVMLPLLSFLHWFIPNWGIVIIVFSIIIKIVLHPLTKSSMKSMKKMQALQPMMNEIREKHKDDPAKMNQAIMNLYKEYGVNPAGGCLPLLLQFPILIALYNVFRAAIELRQSSFVWWITDLSTPDTIVSLPFELPLVGMKNVSGLALLMGITMYIQQKMTIKDPRQKMMVWMMPILMTLLFNAFPSGLNLYYFVFNLLSIGQQMLMSKQDNEPLRKVDPKKRQQGIFGRVTRDLPRFKR
ncbi:MAG TPA: membrane protein insertase YidC [Bacteroidota bacterium]|nr:membrane protein insertase YidC [Bacteroidota bacterium]